MHTLFNSGFGLLIVIAVALAGLLWLPWRLVRLQERIRARYRLRFGLRELVSALAFLAVLCLVRPVYAQNVYQPNFYKAYTTVLTNGQTLTLTNTTLFDYLRSGTGEGAFIFATATNTTAAAVTAKFDVSPDGTNYTTTSPFALSVALNSTTQVGNYTNWPASGTSPTLNNARKFALTSLANAHTNSVTVTVWISHMNQ